jgi:superfamily II DNA/RNA helicase
MLDDGGYPKDAVNCIVMAPTRELAQQIDQAMQGFGYYLDGVSSVAVYGGNDGTRFDQETRGLKMGADVIIATPGRLLSHIKMGNVDLSRLSFFVLDEADRMLDMGFSDDILQIAKLLPQNHQTIMFSATMPTKIQQLARTLLYNPVEVKIAVSKPAEKIQQSAYLCYEPQKLGIIRHLFKAGELQRVIIFSGKKDKVKDITRELQRMHINCAPMHSDLTQQERDDVMYRFKAGQVDVLVATDIVARGIDIDDILMVINYDVPRDVEDYVHRIGRTARAQRDGVAITFVSDADMRYFFNIEQFLAKEILKQPLPEGLGEAPAYQTVAPRKATRGRGGKNRNGKRYGAKRHNNRHHKGNNKPNDNK